MVITHKIRPMDLAERSVTQRVDTVQDDKYSRNLEIPLIANGAPWVIPDGTTAVIRFKKSDGTGGNYDTMPDGSAAYIISGNKLTVALAPQVCTAPGAVLLAVGLIYGDAEINTFSINITVHPNPGINVASEDYTNMRSYVKSTGWEPNVYLGTDDDGNIIPVYVDAQKPKSTAVTLLASGWDDLENEQLTEVSGVLADETLQLIQICPAGESMTAYYDAGIICTGQYDGGLVFTAKTIPSVDLTVYVVVTEVQTA